MGNTSGTQGYEYPQKTQERLLLAPGPLSLEARSPPQTLAIKRMTTLLSLSFLVIVAKLRLLSQSTEAAGQVF